MKNNCEHVTLTPLLRARAGARYFGYTDVPAGRIFSLHLFFEVRAIRGGAE